MQQATAVFSHTEIEKLRSEFPILASSVESGKSLIYLDWAATAQKPLAVINAEVEFYSKYNGAIDRGTHFLVGEATTRFKQARATLAKFIGAQEQEIVWTKNATEAINLVAYSLENIHHNGDIQHPLYLKVGDEICISRAEHHANLVPWQQLAKRTGIKLNWLELTPTGAIDLTSLAQAINTRTKLVAITHVSNVTGLITPLETIVTRAREVGALVLLDSCQSAAHLAIDVKQLDVDFAVFSAHKMFGPTGIGALFARENILQLMAPFLTGGGSMIKHVTMQETEFNLGYAQFEAGTQAVAQIYAWAVALEYLTKLGMAKIHQQEQFLLQYLLSKLQTFKHLKLLGSADPTAKSALVAFAIDNIHPHDVGQILNEFGIAVRVGHHCAMPIHKFFDVTASTRVSLSFLNTLEEIDLFIDALANTQDFFN